MINLVRRGVNQDQNGRSMTKLDITRQLDDNFKNQEIPTDKYTHIVIPSHVGELLL